MYPPYECTRGILWFSRRYAASADTSSLTQLKKSWKYCFHILYVDWYCLIIEGPPRALRIANNELFLHCGPYMKNWGLFFPLLYIYLLCERSYAPEILATLGSTYETPRTPQIWKKKLDLNLKSSYHMTRNYGNFGHYQITCVWWTFIYFRKYCDIPLSTRNNHYVLNNQLYV